MFSFILALQDLGCGPVSDANHWNYSDLGVTDCLHCSRVTRKIEPVESLKDLSVQEKHLLRFFELEVMEARMRPVQARNGIRADPWSAEIEILNDQREVNRALEMNQRFVPVDGKRQRRNRTDDSPTLEPFSSGQRIRPTLLLRRTSSRPLHFLSIQHETAVPSDPIHEKS